MAMNAKASSFRSATHSRSAQWRALCCCLFALAASGCDKIGDLLDDDDETFHIRSLDLVEDAPTLNFLIDGTAVSSSDYGSGSGFSAAHPGSRTLSLKAVQPPTLDSDDDDDDPVAVGPSIVRSFTKDTPYTAVWYGQLADPRVFFIEGWSQRSDVSDDKVVLQFTHAAPDAPQVDVYVSMPQAGVTVSQYVATLSLTEASTPLELTLTRDADDLDDDSSLTGKLTVQVLRAGSSEMLYQSDEIAVGERSRILFAIAGNKGPGPSALKLISLVGGSTSTFLDKDEQASLRFTHIAPAAPNLDVIAGTHVYTAFAQNIGFGATSDYLNVEPGEVGMIATPTGQPANITFLEEFSAAAGTTYSAYAVGPSGETDAFVISDETRSIPTQPSFRFLHAAASLEDQDALDIYLRSPGEEVDFDDDDTAPSYSSVAYQTTTSYTVLKQGSYDVYFAYAGTSTVVLGPISFTVSNGDITTLALIDNAAGQLELMPVSDAR